MDNPSDPNQSISRNFGFLTKIRYGGVLGKVLAIGASFFVTLCFLAVASWGNPYLLGGIAVIAFVGFLFLVWQMKTIFMAHPDLVTLEGKEVIDYRQLELRLKGKQPRVVEEMMESPALPPPNNLLLFPESKERKDD